MSRYAFSIVSLVLVVSILLSACKKSEPPFECADSIGCVTIAPDDPIKLVELTVMTHSSESLLIFCQEITRGFELALAERGNELLGHPVELQQEDDACTGEGGANAALRVVADPQVLGGFGTVCSGAAVEASPIMAEAGLVMISANNQAPGLTAVGGVPGEAWQPGYFRTVYNGAALSEAAAYFAFDELGVTKVAVIDDGTATTTGFSDAFGQIFAALGGEVVLSTAVASGDTDMKPVLTAIANAAPELLFISLRGQEGVPLLQQMKEVPGTEDMILLSTATMYDDDELIEMGDDALRLHLTVPVPLSGPAVDQVVADYEAAYDMARPSRDQFIYAYDGANLLLDAIEAVAVQEKDGTLHVGRQALRDALYATAGYEGVSGSLACDQHGDCAFAEFNVWRLDNPAAGLEGLQAAYTYTLGE